MKIEQDTRTGRTTAGGQQIARDFAELRRALESGKLEPKVEEAVYLFFDEKYDEEQDRHDW